MSCKAALKKEAKYTTDAWWTFVFFSLFFSNSIVRAIRTRLVCDLHKTISRQVVKYSVQLQDLLQLNNLDAKISAKFINLLVRLVILNL